MQIRQTEEIFRIVEAEKEFDPPRWWRPIIITTETNRIWVATPHQKNPIRNGEGAKWTQQLEKPQLASFSRLIGRRRAAQIVSDQRRDREQNNNNNIVSFFVFFLLSFWAGYTTIGSCTNTLESNKKKRDK